MAAAVRDFRKMARKTPPTS